MDGGPLTQLFEFVQTLWTELIVPFFAMLWNLAWQDPMSFVAVLIIICLMIWAYQESVRLGR